VFALPVRQCAMILPPSPRYSSTHWCCFSLRIIVRWWETNNQLLKCRHQPSTVSQANYHWHP